MKYILLLLLMYTAPAHAQVIQDKQGNYILAQAQSTGKTFTDAKGIKYPIMKSIKGKYFFVRTSKQGKAYKQYLDIKP